MGFRRMTYGMEVVPLNKKEEHSLEVAETRILWLSYEVTRWDKIRNEFVRNEMNVGALHGKPRSALSGRVRWQEKNKAMLANWLNNYV